MQRSLQPEILDRLPPDDPAARHSRRDLRIINRAMANHRWFQQILPTVAAPDERVLEIGAGEGELAGRLRAQVPALDGLDLWPRPPHWPAAARWHQVDVFNFDRWADYPVVIGNLVFHHFSAAQLAGLGRQLDVHARVFVACETARRRRFQTIFALFCRLIGANRVTRHDGHVSIAAGFIDDELPALLGLDRARWRWDVSYGSFGAYRLVATRR